MTLQNNNKKMRREIYFFEFALFVIYVCIIALRLSFMENPHVESLGLRGSFYDNFLSVSISCLLIILAIFWFIVRTWSTNFKFRPGGLGYGILIFIIACAISTITASNRRAGITDSITIISAMLTAAVLANLADTITRKKILLCVIISMGIANVYQCSDQFFSSNEFMIKQYETEPIRQIRSLGIEPGSFQHMLYEHRLYSKDVRGFFTTGNSSAGLLVFAIFCVFAVFDFKPGLYASSTFSTALKTGPSALLRAGGKLWLPMVLLLIFLAGLWETHSKGAIVSFAIAGTLLFLAVRFGRIIRRRSVTVILTAVVVIIACVILITSYGKTHNRLPGGNSMLVRWQYWSAAAKIIRNNLLTGTGGGNFGSYYTQYKIPQAIETVKDPHCFVLSIAAQYGIIGLTGFCMAIFFPLIRACLQNKLSFQHIQKDTTTAAKICGIWIVSALLLARPVAIRAEMVGDIEVVLYVIAVMYAAPVFCFGVTFWLCFRNNCEGKGVGIYPAALLCGLFAMLIHNLIDFAIFEPGIMTAFWACIAVLYADRHIENNINNGTEPNKLKKIIFTVSAIILTAAIIRLCLIPVAKVAIKTERANQLLSEGEFEEATALLADANSEDILNPTPAAIAGKMLLYKFNMNPDNSPRILFRAENLLLAAIERDRADFKNYENLANVYRTLAQISSEKRLFWSQKAFLRFKQALALNPSSAELHVELAKITEQLGWTESAIEHYKKAIEIEDAYTEQFKIMYPGKEVFSRMGKIKYNDAKEKLEELTIQNSELIRRR